LSPSREGENQGGKGKEGGGWGERGGKRSRHKLRGNNISFLKLELTVQTFHHGQRKRTMVPLP